MEVSVKIKYVFFKHFLGGHKVYLEFMNAQRDGMHFCFEQANF
jgi:hypothetical protein